MFCVAYGQFHFCCGLVPFSVCQLEALFHRNTLDTPPFENGDIWAFWRRCTKEVSRLNQWFSGCRGSAQIMLTLLPRRKLCFPEIRRSEKVWHFGYFFRTCWNPGFGGSGKKLQKNVLSQNARFSVFQLEALFHPNTPAFENGDIWAFRRRCTKGVSQLKQWFSGFRGSVQVRW